MTAEPLDPRSEPLHSVEEVAARLRISRMSVYRLVEKYEIRAYRMGRTIRVPESAISEFLMESDTFGGKS